MDYCTEDEIQSLLTYLLDSSHHNVLDGLLQRHYLLNLLWRGARGGGGQQREAKGEEIEKEEEGY